MAEASGKILEGVFAIDKPPHLSSAQVLRDLQTHFATSKTFAPLLHETLAKKEEQRRHQPKRRRTRDNDNVFKMGHGGTLDPMATGVLIVGIGKGTKHLNTFLGCTKTYETVVLFGKSTDTYDVAGKVVAEAPYTQVTRELVEEKLSKFRGEIKQMPPIYSALKIDGMKAYEYARSGKELPRQLESREMKVTECTMLEWYEGGRHSYRWPAEEASAEEKGVAKKLMEAAGSSSANLESTESSTTTVAAADTAATPSEPQDQASQPPPTNDTPVENISPSKAAQHTHALPPSSATPSPAPAARFLLSVSSGFYVRSFAHDLGLACSSLGMMASLVRSQQADFFTPEHKTSTSADKSLIPALPYDDLALGENVWGPKVQHMLEQWYSAHPDLPKVERIDDRDRPGQWQKHKSKPRDNQDRGSGKRDSGYGGHKRGYSGGSDFKRRRNSSSPEA